MLTVRFINTVCNISPDALHHLVLVGVLAAVAELHQLPVDPLKVPHHVGYLNCPEMIKQLSLEFNGQAASSVMRQTGRVSAAAAALIQQTAHSLLQSGV